MLDFLLLQFLFVDVHLGLKIESVLFLLILRAYQRLILVLQILDLL